MFYKHHSSSCSVDSLSLRPNYQLLAKECALNTCKLHVTGLPKNIQVKQLTVPICHQLFTMDVKRHFKQNKTIKNRPIDAFSLCHQDNNSVWVLRDKLRVMAI